MKTNKNFLFWQKWLLYSSLLLAALGIAIALFGNHQIFLPYTRMLAKVFWNQTILPPSADSFRAFAWGPLGGTIASSYILLAYIAWKPFNNKEVWSRNAIIVAYGFWFVLDSAVCLYYKVFFQAYIINTISLLQKMLPVVFTWKAFKK